MLAILLFIFAEALHPLDFPNLKPEELTWIKNRKNKRLFLALSLNMAASVRQHGLQERQQFKLRIEQLAEEFKSVNHANEGVVDKFVKYAETSKAPASAVIEFKNNYYQLREYVQVHLAWVRMYDIILDNQSPKTIDDIKAALENDLEPNYVKYYFSLIENMHVSEEMINEANQNDNIQQFIMNSFKAENSGFEKYMDDVIELMQSLAVTAKDTPLGAHIQQNLQHVRQLK